MFAKLNRAIRGLYAFGRIVRDPGRLDEVFGLSDSAMDPRELDSLAERVAQGEGGSQALLRRHRVPKPDLARLRELPVGTVGRSYADFMLSQGLDPGSIPTLPAPNDGEYARAHLYETHDLWHVATGFHTDVNSELGLQAFYAAQVGGPLPVLLLAAGFLNLILFVPGEYRARFDAIVRGWQMGQAAKPLFGLRWNELWEKNLGELRGELRLA